MSEELYNTSGKKVCFEDFSLMKVVGRGSFGKVLQVKKKDTGRIYAMKVLDKNRVKITKQEKHTNDEKKILQSINHPFIVKLHYAFQTPEKLYMVMDFVNGGEIFHHLEEEDHFSEERTKFYTAEIALGLMHLHSHGIVYRDLKPENVLIDRTGNIVITDFGLSKQLSNENDETSTFCGTPDYLAPEILTAKGHGMAVDFWSLGILTYEMLSGFTPFSSEDEDNQNETFQNILNKEPEFLPSMSSDAQDFISKCLKKNPEERITAEQIKQHPWFAEYDWAKLEKKEIKPPYIPHVNGLEDVQNIDEEFIEEDPEQNTLTEKANIGEDDFQGFTFKNDNAIDNQM